MLKSLEFVVGLVIFLFLFFSLFLFFFQKGNRLSKNLLGFFFMSLGLAVADVFLLKSGTYLQFPQYAYFLNSLPLVYGPLLWLFTRSVIRSSYSISWADLVHFIPYGLMQISLIFIYHIQHVEFKKEFIRRALEDPGLIASIFSIVVFISIGVYIFISHQSIQSYRRRIREEVSNIDKINLEWLDFTLLGFIIVLILSFAVQIVFIFFPNNSGLNLLILILLFVMFIFIMGAIIKGLRTDVSFSTTLVRSEDDHKGIKTLNEKELVKLKELKTIMRSDKPYLTPTLSLQDLATLMSTSSRELSYLINHGEGISFFDFINRYRIQYAQEKIVQSKDEKQTILEVMYASGFNSKSSFNTAFKKHTGHTPTQWKKLNT